jgi:hypothetical protein
VARKDGVIGGIRGTLKDFKGTLGQAEKVLSHFDPKRQRGQRPIEKDRELEMAQMYAINHLVPRMRGFIDMLPAADEAYFKTLVAQLLLQLTTALPLALRALPTPRSLESIRAETDKVWDDFLVSVGHAPKLATPEDRATSHPDDPSAGVDSRGQAPGVTRIEISAPGPALLPGPVSESEKRGAPHNAQETPRPSVV